jgi:hypothetical protein
MVTINTDTMRTKVTAWADVRVVEVEHTRDKILALSPDTTPDGLPDFAREVYDQFLKAVDGIRSIEARILELIARNEKLWEQVNG